MIDTLDPIKDLLAEVGDRNVVRVMKYAAIRPDPRGRTIHQLVHDELSRESQAVLPALHAHDTLRLLAGKPAIYVPEALRLFGAEFIDAGFNLRVNDGIDFVYNQLSGTSVAIADTLALSNNTLAVAVTDHASSTLPWSTAQATDVAAGAGTGEWSALGMARKVATTNSHSASATTYTLAATWTATGTVTATSKIGLLGGAGKNTIGTGTLVLANTFTATTLANGDQLTVTWTVTI